MPAITPLQYEVRGITEKHEIFRGSRTVPYSWTTLVELPINATDICDVLVVGHIVADKGGGSRQAAIEIRVRLDSTTVGEGRAVCGSVDAGHAPTSSGFLASARNVSAGSHTIRVQGRASSTLGDATVYSRQLAVSVIEFYR